MFIRAVSHTNKKNGKKYNNHRLSETYRNQSGKVRQHTILVLGADFSVDKSQWKPLADRIEEICSGQRSLFMLEPKLEKKAESIAKLVIKKRSQSKADPVKTMPKAESVVKTEKDFQSADLNSLEHQDIRQIGAEYLGVTAANQLELNKILSLAGLTKNRQTQLWEVL